MTARPRKPEASNGPEQSELLGPDAWSLFLSRELGLEVQVVYTRARRSVLKVEPHGSRRTVRMNSFFAAAPIEIQYAVVAWVRSGRRARRQLALLDTWIESQIELLEKQAPRKVRTVSAGRVHDLERLARELRESEFAGQFAAESGTESELATWPRLTWGRAPRSRSRRTLRLGSYDYWSGLVRMHPVLDQVSVPESFVRYVLFHELLHAALPAERGARGRRIFHSGEFRRRETEYSGTKAALAWEKQHLQELLWSARTGNEMRPAKTLAIKLAARDRAPAIEEALIPAKSGVRRFLQRWLF